MRIVSNFVRSLVDIFSQHIAQLHGNKVWPLKNILVYLLFVYCLTCVHFSYSQLESELTALTEESNAKLTQLSQQVDELRTDRVKLEEIFQLRLKEDIPADDLTPTILETYKQNDQYMRYEIQKSVAAYASMNEQLIGLNRKINDLVKKNKILANRLRENGLDDAILLKESHNELAVIKKRAQSYQGIFKYDNKDRRQILQKLIVDLTPRVAITLLPGLPAYIVFMCIR